MEPETNQTESIIGPLKKVTPVSKYLAMVLFVVLPFVGGWIGYMLAQEKLVQIQPFQSESTDVVRENFLNSSEIVNTPQLTSLDSETSITTQEFRNEFVGVSFHVPSEWNIQTSVDYSEVVNKEPFSFKLDDYVIVQAYSPDYARDYYYPDDIIKTGARISVSTFPITVKNIDNPIWTPEGYIRFMEDLNMDCGDCLSSQRITLAGEQAFMTRVAYAPDLYKSPKGEQIFVRLIHNGQIVRIQFDYAQYSDLNQTIFKKFLETFAFLP